MSSHQDILTIEDPTFSEVIQQSFVTIKNGIKSSNSLPFSENFNYYTCFPVYNEICGLQIKRINDIMQKIIQKAGILDNIKQRDLEEKYDLILESNDIFLDRAGTFMDEFSGICRNPNVELIISQTKLIDNLNGSWNATRSLPNKQSLSSFNSVQAIRLLSGKNIQRPQLYFKDKIDNSQKPWEPKIKYKPNSLKPLALYIEHGENEEGIFCHPYEFELNKFIPPENQLIKKAIIKFKSIDETPLVMINKIQDLQIILQDLKNYNEIAVDLEHHSYRSFQGITCLMQISTRDTDYLIDTLSLRSDLHILNEIFTKSSVLKVFHGADSDILWLQRDLSLYVINMFDTYQAAKQLELPFLSLSYLLKQYCKIDTNKHFQLADWRIRPLPNELMKYAREDTHYLLYLKDVLSNALIDFANGQNNILKAVYAQSTAICKSTYTKPVWTENSHLSIYRKSKKMFNNQQLFALKELHKWRDETARIEDDSTNYVLPNHMLLNIAETLPREMQGILACCNPIPPLVRQNLLKIHKMILKAREQPLIKAILEDDIKQRLTQRSQVLNSESWIYTPHDIQIDNEIRANLPCLLNVFPKKFKEINQFKYKPIISIYDTSSIEEDELSKTEVVKKKKLVFISPFERYKRVQPIIIEEEKRENVKILIELQKNTKKTIVNINQLQDPCMKETFNSNVSSGNKNIINTVLLSSLSHVSGKKRKRA